MTHNSSIPATSAYSSYSSTRASPFTVDEILYSLQNTLKVLARICPMMLPTACKQLDGESFSDYYARLKNLAEELGQCSNNPITYAGRSSRWWSCREIKIRNFCSISFLSTQLHLSRHLLSAACHFRLLVLRPTICMPSQTSFVLFPHLRRSNDRKTANPHLNSLASVLHASPATASTVCDASPSLPATVTAAVKWVTGPKVPVG